MTQPTPFLEQLAALADDLNAVANRHANQIDRDDWRKIVLAAGAMRNPPPAILALGRERDALRSAGEDVLAWHYRIEGKVPQSHTALGRLAAALEGGNHEQG